MGLRIVSGTSFVGAVKRCHEACLTASSLARGGAACVALEQAATRGARVSVQLDADPYDPGASGGRARANAAVAAELRAHGVKVALVAGPPGAPLHLKAAIVDGRLFLDDRNWVVGGRDVIVTTRGEEEVGAVRAAMRGARASSELLALRKGQALAMERDTIEHTGGESVVAESESFGNGVVADALLERAAEGKTVRLLVNGREARGAREKAVLKRLSAAGVRVRLESGGRNEKLCVAGNRAWVGSANATAGFPDTIDWGARMTSPSALRALRETFERHWREARPWGAEKGESAAPKAARTSGSCV